MALGKKIASQTVGDLTGIDPIVLLLSCRNRSQHQGMSHLDLRGMRKEMVVDPAAEDRCFHANTPWLRQSLHPAIQLAPSRSNLAFLLNPATHVLHAVADRLLVNVKSDVIHMLSRSLRGSSLNQRHRLTNIQTIRPETLDGGEIY